VELTLWLWNTMALPAIKRASTSNRMLSWLISTWAWGQRELMSRQRLNSLNLGCGAKACPIVSVLVQFDEVNVDGLTGRVDRQTLSFLPHFGRNHGTWSKNQNISALVLLLAGDQPQDDENDGGDGKQRQVPQTNGYNGPN
jgi:hypothetical protein